MNFSDGRCRALFNLITFFMYTINEGTPIAALTVGQFKELFYSSFRIESPQQPEADPAIFGVEGCKKLTGYSASAIYQRTSNGLIPCFRRDGKLLFRREEIISWMTSNRKETKEEVVRNLDEKLTKSKGGRK